MGNQKLTIKRRKRTDVQYFPDAARRMGLWGFALVQGSVYTDVTNLMHVKS
jgi:virulence-associated protein VapD